MKTRRVLAIGLVSLIAALDGFDGLAMAFVAPALGAEWSIDRATVGLLLSCGLFGMAGGALGLAPLADIVGRKPGLLGGLALMGLGSWASGIATSVAELVAYRLVTGLGVGLVVALTALVASELASEKSRALAVAATTVGFSLGCVVGGFASAVILAHYHWSLIFQLGGVLTLALFAVTMFCLPETPAFLIASRPAKALARLNRSLVSLGEPAVSALPPAPIATRRSYRMLFSSELVVETIRFAAAYVLVAIAVYYLLSWLPQFVADSGHAPSTGSLLSACTSLAGVIGALSFGAIASRVDPKRLAAITMVGFAVSLAAFGWVPPKLSIMVLAACVCGFFLSASTAVLYAALANAFPPMVRASGLGFVMGVGRTLSGLGPLIAGWLFARGYERGSVTLLFASSAAIAGLLLVIPFKNTFAAANLKTMENL